MGRPGFARRHYASLSVTEWAPMTPMKYQPALAHLRPLRNTTGDMPKAATYAEFRQEAEWHAFSQAVEKSPARAGRRDGWADIVSAGATACAPWSHFHRHGRAAALHYRHESFVAAQSEYFFLARHGARLQPRAHFLLLPPPLPGISRRHADSVASARDISPPLLAPAIIAATPVQQRPPYIGASRARSNNMRVVMGPPTPKHFTPNDQLRRIF